MAGLLITDEAWSLIADVFPARKQTGRPPTDRRQVLNAILWILRTGAPWRDLPTECGKWQTVSCLLISGTVMGRWILFCVDCGLPTSTLVN
jgi:transposase